MHHLKYNTIVFKIGDKGDDAIMMQDLVTEKWEEFLKKYCWDRIIELSNYYPERRSLLVIFSDVDLYDSNLADMLLEDPDVTIESVTRALREMDIPTGVTLDETNVSNNKASEEGKDTRHQKQ